MSGALDKSLFDENTILLEIIEENGRRRYVYIGGDMILSLLTNGNIYNYISSMGNNLTPYSIAIDEENIYFLTPHFKFIENDWIDDRELLNTKEISFAPFDYDVSIC